MPLTVGGSNGSNLLSYINHVLIRFLQSDHSYFAHVLIILLILHDILYQSVINKLVFLTYLQHVVVGLLILPAKNL